MRASSAKEGADYNIGALPSSFAMIDVRSLNR
jgi:hypothetical protein